MLNGWYHSPLIKHKQLYWEDIEATRQLPRMHIHCWVNKSQTIKAYKINMFCNFLSTCAWLYIKSHQGKGAGCLRSRLHLPEGRGNPYLAASSDFIPRNPAPRAPIQQLTDSNSGWRETFFNCFFKNSMPETNCVSILYISGVKQSGDRVYGYSRAALPKRSI